MIPIDARHLQRMLDYVSAMRNGSVTLLREPITFWSFARHWSWSTTLGLAILPRRIRGASTAPGRCLAVFLNGTVSSSVPRPEGAQALAETSGRIPCARPTFRLARSHRRSPQDRFLAAFDRAPRDPHRKSNRGDPCYTCEKWCTFIGALQLASTVAASVAPWLHGLLMQLCRGFQKSHQP